ncbi:acyl-homoserine-lactone synthase [Bradyrhizobium sp. RT5a]|uniref:acyl-homoserine-lactone synthase n=1 Tax=unclassified Bradyrhizobium TaxID=2631580 RepID=UPI00339A166E
MIQLIAPEYYGEFVHELAEIHRLRYRVFKQRLDWSVETSGDMEIDEFDVLRPVHLLNRSTAGYIQGCVRLLPSTGSTMLRDTFPILLEGQPAHEAVRSGRAADLRSIFRRTRRKQVADFAAATYELFAGMIEFGLSIELTEIVTVTDARMERILRRADWPLRPIGKACPLGNTTAIAGYLADSNDRRNSDLVHS